MLRRGNHRNIAIAFAITRRFRNGTRAMPCLTGITRRETVMSKRILVTGAGSGFGKAASIGMAKNGHRVIATTQVSSQVTPLREEAKALGIEKNLRVERLDLTDSYDIAQALTFDIDVLWNNAGMGED